MHDWAEFRHFRYLLAILEEQGFRAAADGGHDQARRTVTDQSGA